MSTHFRLRRPGAASALKRAGPVVAAAIAAMLVLAPAASPAGSYTDPAGDNATAGDITGLTVSGDKSSGQLAFRLTGNLAISDTVPLLLFIDSDANPMTGNIMDVGADYIFAVGSDGYDFEHWNGVDWVDTPFATVRVFGSSQAITISVNKSEIGNTSDINFWAESFDSVGKKWDDAPNDGAFNYSLDSDGPLINSVDLQTEPTTGPKAGKKFVVTPTALHLPPDGRAAATPLLPESYTCTAKLGAKTLVGTGTGSCTVKVPKKKARGKTLSVTVTVVYQGATKAFPYSFKVR
ncbi:MAG TPA: hypothetical protein VIU81_11275 [Gaiellaceae bacterium]